MNALDELLCTLEALRNATSARDANKAHEAVTVFLMEFASFFGVGSDFFKKTFPILEQLREHVENERFDEAGTLTIAFLAQIRRAKKAME